MDEKIDISPLFETEKGLSTGHEVISSLLKNVHYKKYVIKRKKNGYSITVYKYEIMICIEILYIQY